MNTLKAHSSKLSWMDDNGNSNAQNIGIQKLGRVIFGAPYPESHFHSTTRNHLHLPQHLAESPIFRVFVIPQGSPTKPVPPGQIHLSRWSVRTPILRVPLRSGARARWPGNCWPHPWHPTMWTWMKWPMGGWLRVLVERANGSELHS